jgi:hypothetical protein
MGWKVSLCERLAYQILENGYGQKGQLGLIHEIRIWATLHPGTTS